MLSHPSSWRRGLSVLLASAIAYSSSAVGFHAVSSAFSTTLSELLSEAPGHYTDAPTSVYRGNNPKREPKKRGGMWSDAALQDADDSQNGGLQASIGGAYYVAGTPVAAESGGSSSWEGAASSADGELNTGNGNKLTSLNLFSWKERGGMAVDFSLHHNAQGTYNDELGHGWSWTYDIYINDGSSTATVHWGNGTCIPFTAPGGGGSTGGGGMLTGGGGGQLESEENLSASIEGSAEFATTYTAPTGVYDSLVKNDNGTWTLTSKDQLKYDFNTAGFCNKITDRNGNQITITLDSNNHATRVTGPSGRYLSISVDTNGNFQSVTDPGSRTWTFTRNGSDDLTTVAWPTLDSNNYSDVYAYNGAHDITTYTDKRGKNWVFTYNTDSSLATAKNPLNHTTTYTYTSSATTVTDPLGETTVHNYSGGKLASAVDEAGFSEGYTYDTSNNKLTVTDKRGKVWTYTYDSQGNILTKKDPLNHTWTFTYNTAGDVLTTKDPLNNTTTCTYDTAGNLLTVKDGLNRTTTTHTYDSYGQRLTAKNALNHETTYTYSTDGYPTTITDPLSKSTTVAYDSMGRMTSTTDPNSNTEAISYDAWGRRVTFTHPGSVSSTATYNANGQLTARTNERGKTTQYAYDDAGRLTSTTNANSEAESYGYDNAGRQTSVTNGRGKTRTFSYTDRGEVYTMTLPDSSVETWSYNGNGKASAYTNPLSQTIAYSFDDAGRQTGIDYPAGTDVSFSYDNANRRTSMVDATGTTTWTYNAASEVTQLASPQGTINYTFDNAGRRATMQEVGVGTTTYTFNNGSQLTSLVNPFSETTSWTYDNGGRKSRQTLSSGAYSDFGYDSRNRVTSLVHKKSDGTTISSESYVYDNTGNPTSKTVNGTTMAYTFSHTDQLLTESRTGYSSTYTYDANGNRLTKVLGGVTDSYTYDDADKLSSVSQGGTTVKSFGYDTAGRTTSVTTSAGTTTLAYDYEGRLKTLTYPNLSTNTFTYNGFDTRVSKVDSGGTKTYKRDGATVTGSLLNDGSANYTPGVSERRSGATKFVHQDRLGSTERLTDSTQATSDTRQYDAFGTLVGSTGTTATPFGFAGASGYQEDGQSGLTLVGRRYYDASTGRFLTRDPAKHGSNWYVYCGNNPLTRLDPTGETWKDVVHAWSVALAYISSAAGGGVAGVDGVKGEQTPDPWKKPPVSSGGTRPVPGFDPNRTQPVGPPKVYGKYLPIRAEAAPLVRVERYLPVPKGPSDIVRYRPGLGAVGAARGTGSGGGSGSIGTVVGGADALIRGTALVVTYRGRLQDHIDAANDPFDEEAGSRADAWEGA